MTETDNAVASAVNRIADAADANAATVMQFIGEGGARFAEAVVEAQAIESTIDLFIIVFMLMLIVLGAKICDSTFVKTEIHESLTKGDAIGSRIVVDVMVVFVFFMIVDTVMDSVSHSLTKLLMALYNPDYVIYQRIVEAVN